jgi:uncharacterized iron-regulated membrane protein
VKKRSNRRLWFRLHGYFSLPVWLLFCFVCLTGTIAVLSHELTWLTNPDARADNPQELPRQPLSDLVAAAQAAVPGADVGYVMVMEPYLVTAVGVSSPEVPAGIVYVNPYTARVQAVNQGLTFIGFMRALHGWLLFPWQHSWSWGYYLVSAMCIVVLGALATGLVVYKRFWRGYAAPRLRWRSDARTLLGDLHRLAGIWSLWFLLVIGLTGAWYLTQAVLWHAGIEYGSDALPVADDRLSTAIDGAAPQRITVAEAVAAAQQAVPSLEPAWFSPPEHNRDHFRVMGHSDAFFLFDMSSVSVAVNPWTGAVDYLQQPADMNAAEVISHIADPLHYGTFGGLWTKAIWFVFGLVLTGMSVSGFLIWGKRTLRESRPGRRHRVTRQRARRARKATAGAGESA